MYSLELVVVTQDIPDYALVVGNPGKIIGWVNKRGNRLSFDNKGNSICGQFQISNDILIENDTT